MGLDAHTGIQARFAAANRTPVPTLGQRQSLRALQHDMRSKKQKNIVDMLHLGKGPVKIYAQIYLQAPAE